MLGGVAMSGLLWNTAALSTESRQPPYGPAPAPPASTFADFPKKEVYIATGPVPPPLPGAGSQNEPPLTHRYRLLAAKPETFAGGTLRKVSASEFPISTTMSGALLVIEPGGMRELHWHPHAAE
jgi:oxalate decarboxylase